MLRSQTSSSRPSSNICPVDSNSGLSRLSSSLGEGGHSSKSSLDSTRFWDEPSSTSYPHECRGRSRSGSIIETGDGELDSTLTAATTSWEAEPRREASSRPSILTSYSTSPTSPTETTPSRWGSSVHVTGHGGSDEPISSSRRQASKDRATGSRTAPFRRWHPPAISIR